MIEGKQGQDDQQVAEEAEQDAEVTADALKDLKDSVEGNN